ncbi:MAG: hypothetical protein WD872_10590 [Pirellulaceae bacterium]
MLIVAPSNDGGLGQAKVHHGQAELSVDLLNVKAGETLDFVADIGSQLSHNQFLWKSVITEVTSTAAGSPGLVFDSERDFGSQPTAKLAPWEQLAQVLLSANEFVFVD